MYINKDGELVDARNSSEMYDAMQKLRALTQEGLVYTGESNADKVYSKASTILPFLIHDSLNVETVGSLRLRIVVNKERKYGTCFGINFIRI